MADECFKNLFVKIIVFVLLWGMSSLGLLVLVATAWNLIQQPFKDKIEISEVVEDQYQIYSLDTLCKKEDAFVLGLKEDGEFKEYFFLKKEDNHFASRSFKENANLQIEIKESEVDSPQIKYLFEVSALPKDYQRWLGFFEKKEQRKVIIVVPKDTIITQYDM